MNPRHGELITCYCKGCSPELCDDTCDCVMPDPEIGINVPMQDIEHLLSLSPNQRFIQVEQIAEQCNVPTILLERHIDWIDSSETDKILEDRIKKIYCISPLENKIKHLMLSAGIFKQQYRYKYGRADFLIHVNRIMEVDGDSTHGNYKNGYTFHGKSVESVQLEDRQQTEYLQSQGFSVIRFWSHEIWQDIKTSIDKLIQFITSFTFTSFSKSFDVSMKLRDRGDV